MNKEYTKMCDIIERFSQDEECVNYATVAAKHLATNYTQGVWGMWDNGMSKKERDDLELIYNITIFNSKKKYQSHLNGLVLKYFRLKRLTLLESRISFKDVKEIMYYKMVYRPKQAFRKFLYE